MRVIMFLAILAMACATTTTTTVDDAIVTTTTNDVDPIADASLSGSGFCTLLFLIFIGPCIHYGHHLYKTSAKRRGLSRSPPPLTASPVSSQPTEEKAPAATETAGEGEGKEREEVSYMNHLMSLVGYAIGIGNVWRFPYMVGKYGGGSFVLAYLTCLFFVAGPMYYLEGILGQYTRKSTIEAFTMIRPRWASFGWAQAVMLVMTLAYYNLLLVYTLCYIAASMQTPLPWSADSGAYWREEVLGNAGTSEGLGAMQGQLVFGLFVLWVGIFFSVAFGKKILAKVTYVTVVGPVVLMVILVFASSSLEGAGDGMKFYLGKFDGEQLGSLEMWAGACSQIIFSLSPGFGTAITLSSFISPKQDVWRINTIVCLTNSGFSLFSGIAVFAILGNLAHTSGSTVAELASNAGPGLAFITIAEAINIFGDGANVMAVLFFVMLLTLGLDSTFAWLETIICYIQDFLQENTEHKNVPTWKIVGIVCFLFFLVGLPFCTAEGNNLLDVVDHFAVSYYLLLACFLEAVMFGFDFGFERFEHAVMQSTIGNKHTPKGRRLKPTWLVKGIYFYVVPISLLVLLLNMIVTDATETYGGYPGWLNGLGWGCFFILVFITPLTLWKQDFGSLPELDMKNLRPDVIEIDEIETRASVGPENVQNLAPVEEPSPRALFSLSL